MARSRHIIPLDEAEASALWDFISGCLPFVRFSQRASSRLLHLSLAYRATIARFSHTHDHSTTSLPLVSFSVRF